MNRNPIIPINDLIAIQKNPSGGWNLRIKKRPNGRPKITCYPTLEAAAHTVVEKAAGDCTSLKQILDLLGGAERKIINRVEREAPRYYAKVSARYIPVIKEFIADKYEVRFYLRGMLIRRHHEEGVLLVGTNGHMMVLFHDRAGIIEGANELIMPLSKGLVSACRRTKSKERTEEKLQPAWAVFSNDAGQVVAEREEDEKPSIYEFNPSRLYAEHCPPIQGQYPDYRRVIRASGEHAAFDRAAFNPDLIGTFNCLRSLVGDIPFLTLLPTASLEEAKERPFLVKSEKLPEFLGVVMPARAYAGKDLPEWLDLKFDDKEAA